MPNDALHSLFYALVSLLLTMLSQKLVRWLDLMNGCAPEPQVKPAWDQQDRTFIAPMVAPLTLDEVWMLDRRDLTYDEWLVKPPRWMPLPSLAVRAELNRHGYFDDDQPKLSARQQFLNEWPRSIA